MIENWAIILNTADGLSKTAIGIVGTIIGTVIGTVLGAVIGGVIARRTAIKAIEQQATIQARAEFRSQFLKEVYALRERYHEKVQKTDLKTTHDIVKYALINHELAWLKFREFFPDKKQFRLDRLWLKYSYQHKTPPGDPFRGYKMTKKWENRFDDTIQAKNRLKDVAIKRIYNMFNFGL